MNRGRVYSWLPDPDLTAGGRAIREVVQLERLEGADQRRPRLRGRFVRIRNAGRLYEPDPAGGEPKDVPLGDARPDAEGDLLFEPGRGGGRMDRVLLADPEFRWRYEQAAHFGEVNAYHHVDRMAEYIGSLLSDLGAPALPPVTVLVNAHHAATGENGIRDGVRRLKRWVPFQGGHYRLPSDRPRSNPPPPVMPDEDEGPLPRGRWRKYSIVERDPIHPDGEIHLGPGWKLLRYGALVECAGGPYRANASHNPGIIYHEYGHHVTRHTADFSMNARRRPGNQRNAKTALDEGTCDYLAAAMMQTPHIWAFHHRHDSMHAHRRSLQSRRTMLDFDAGADPHDNGTIWASALWDLRQQIARHEPPSARELDRAVLLGLILHGRLLRGPLGGDSTTIQRARPDFATGLRCLLQADDILHAGRHHDAAVRIFASRGIRVDREVEIVA